MDKGERLVNLNHILSKRTGNLPKLAQPIVALPCNQIYMIESERRTKYDTEVAHTSHRMMHKCITVKIGVQKTHKLGKETGELKENRGKCRKVGGKLFFPKRKCGRGNV